MTRIVYLNDIIEPTANAVNITGSGDWVFIGPDAVLLGGATGGRNGINSIASSTRADVAGYVFGELGAAFSSGACVLNVLSEGTVAGETIDVLSTAGGLTTFTGPMTRSGGSAQG